MTEVAKTVRFDAAHALSDDSGKCRNLHGHAYRVEAVAGGEPGPDGVVVDFAELKRALEDEVTGRFDHAFLCHDGAVAEREIAATVERLGMRTVRLPFRTTAENLAAHFFRALRPRVPALVAVRVWETADNCAEFRP